MIDLVRKHDFSVQDTPWPRAGVSLHRKDNRKGEPWRGFILNYGLSRRVVPSFVKLVQGAELGACNVAWERAPDWRLNVYNRPAYEKRIMNDKDYICKSARSGIVPPIWPLRERAILRAWDRENNTEQVGKLLFQVVPTEVQQEVSAADLPLVEATASLIISWLGTPSGYAFLNAKNVRGGLLAAWDYFNNSDPNWTAGTPMLVRLAPPALVDGVKTKAQLWLFEATAFGVISWLRHRGREFCKQAFLEADADSARLGPKSRAHRRMCQALSELGEPSQLEREMIARE